MPSTSILISNLPLYFNYSQVRRFFAVRLGGASIPPYGLKMINDRHGYRTGSCYIRYDDQQSMFRALQLDGLDAFGETISVVRVSDEEFEREIDSFVPKMNFSYRSIRHRSRSPLSRSRSPFDRFRLPCPRDLAAVQPKDLSINGSIKKVDRLIEKLEKLPTCVDSRKVVSKVFRSSDFETVGLPKEYLCGIIDICKGILGEHVLTAQQSLPENDLVSPMTQDPNYNIVPKVSSSLQRLQSDATPFAEPRQDDVTTPLTNHLSGGSKTFQKFYCIRVRGLPSFTGVETIKCLFRGLEIARDGLHLAPNGSSQGTAFVQFVTHTDCQRALERNRLCIGSKQIEVEPLHKSDMMIQVGTRRLDKSSR